MIRHLAPTETALVQQFYEAAPEYWQLAEGRCEPARQADEFFTDAPPGCDPAQSARLGLFLDGRLSGVAEVSFGFPNPGDAYLGVMVLGQWAQGAGHGARFLAREGFTPTGIRRQDSDTGQWLERLALPL
jgi:hypothetical protein